MKLFWIALFGLLGVFSRYGIGILVTRFSVSPFPYATFLINILGSFLIGVVYVSGVERQGISSSLTVGIMVGFLGGFTTFSSYCLETGRMLEQRLFVPAALYFCLIPMLGLAAAFMGFWIARASR